jgi:hypothetical protein
MFLLFVFQLFHARLVYLSSSTCCAHMCVFKGAVCFLTAVSRERPATLFPPADFLNVSRAGPGLSLSPLSRCINRRVMTTLLDCSFVVVSFLKRLRLWPWRRDERLWELLLSIDLEMNRKRATTNTRNNLQSDRHAPIYNDRWEEEEESDGRQRQLFRPGQDSQ